MRTALALVLVVSGCGAGAPGTASDAMLGGDAPADTPAVEPDAAPDVAATPDAPADVPNAQSDGRAEAPTDATGDATAADAWSDAGPFTCGPGVTCQGNQYCVPECCTGCGAITDGDPCPAGATRCTLGSGMPGCRTCTRAMCTSGIGAGCSGGNPVEPRLLTCRCG
jgi:hypothetical protein